MLKAQGNLADALKYSLKGTLFSERRTGDTWVRGLFNLLQIIVHLITPFEHDVTPGFSKEGQLWIVLYGYLHELVCAATKIFGSSAMYTKTVEAWYKKCLDEDEIPAWPGTRAFAGLFKRSQNNLLLWAGVGEECDIVLV
jgi:hypothetical protein